MLVQGPRYGAPYPYTLGVMNSTTNAPVAFLYRVYATEGLVDDIGLLRAAAQCLTSDELKDVLVAEAGHSSELRDAVLRRVIQEPALLPEQAKEQMAVSLLDALDDADARARQSIGHCLSALHPQLPPHWQRRTEETFLSSRFVGLRKRGYKLQATAKNADLNALRECWKSFRDPECAWLLAKHLAPQELIPCRAELLPVLDEPWKTSRMFLRMAEAQPSVLEELKHRDVISYCYVLAKLGRSVTDREARKFIQKSEADERLGLLVWALGRMKLGKTLRWLLSELPRIQERKIRSYSAR